MESPGPAAACKSARTCPAALRVFAEPCPSLSRVFSKSFPSEPRSTLQEGEAEAEAEAEAEILKISEISRRGLCGFFSLSHTSLSRLAVFGLAPPPLPLQPHTLPLAADIYISIVVWAGRAFRPALSSAAEAWRSRRFQRYGGTERRKEGRRDERRDGETKGGAR